MAGSSGASFGGGSSSSAGGVDKAGSVAAGAFAGDPQQAAVVFAVPFTEAPVVGCVVEVSSGALRYNPNVLNVTATGFTLDLGSGTDLSNLVRVWWSASEVPAEVVPPVVLPSDIDAFLLGHSLLNFEMPYMLRRFVEASAELTLGYDIAVGPGANLQFQWNNPGNAGGDNPSVFLQAGPYDILVLTEATPIANQIVDAASATNALNFIGLAYAENAAVKPLFYEVWDGNGDGGDPVAPDLPAWRFTVDENRKVYEEILEDINTGHPGETVRLIPGGQAIGALYDAALALEIPSFTTADIFIDTDGHLTDTGNYFVACVFFATIYQRTPVGLPATVLGASDAAFDPISAPTAAALQALAWRVVQADPLSGVDAEAGRPTIVGRSPAIRAEDVALDGAVVVTFDQAMDPATITTSTVYLVAGGTVVPATVGYSGLDATLTPDADLAADTEYTLVVTTGAQSASSNTALGAQRAWTFETGSGAVLPAPELNTTSPSAGPGASRFNGVTLYFFQDIDPTTVDETTFLVTETAGGTPVAGTRTVTDGTIEFDGVAHFDPGTQYRVQLLAAVEGLPPRGPVVPIDYTFTTS